MTTTRRTRTKTRRQRNPQLRHNLLSGRGNVYTSSRTGLFSVPFSEVCVYFVRYRSRVPVNTQPHTHTRVHMYEGRVDSKAGTCRFACFPSLLVNKWACSTVRTYRTRWLTRHQVKITSASRYVVASISSLVWFVFPVTNVRRYRQIDRYIDGWMGG